MATSSNWGRLVNMQAALRKPLLIPFGLFSPGDDVSFIANNPANTTIANIRDFGAIPNDVSQAALNKIQIDRAIASLGTAPGTVFVPDGTWSTTGGHQLRYSYQQLIGTGNASILQKTTATGDLVYVNPASGFIYWNGIRNIFLKNADTVTPTAGALLRTNDSAILGQAEWVTMGNAFGGFKHRGQNWKGGNLSMTDCVATGYAYDLRGGLWSRIEGVNNTIGATGLIINDADGLQIGELFLEGRYNYGIKSTPDSGLGQSVLDVNIGNFEIDLFIINAIALGGTGVNNVIAFNTIHLGNQTPNASNGAALLVNGKGHHIQVSTGRIFNNQKEGARIESGPTNATDFIFQGVDFLSNSLASSGTYSALYAYCNKLQVHGCNFGPYVGASASHKYDIELDTSTDSSNITGNVLAGYVTAPLKYPTSITNSVVANNIPLANTTSLAAAGTLTFPALEYPKTGVVQLTGATVGGSGVTAVAGLITGQVLTIITDNAQTFTAGATIGNTLTTVAGIPVTAEFDGTKIYLK